MRNEEMAGMFEKTPPLPGNLKGLQIAINQDGIMKQAGLPTFQPPTGKPVVDVTPPTAIPQGGLTYTPLANPYSAFKPEDRKAAFARQATGLQGPAALDVAQAANSDALMAGAQNFEKGVAFDSDERGRKQAIDRFNQNFSLEQSAQAKRAQDEQSARTNQMWQTFIQVLPYVAAGAKSIGGIK